MSRRKKIFFSQENGAKQTLIAVAGGMCYIENRRHADKKGRRDRDTKEDCKTMHTSADQILADFGLTMIEKTKPL